MYTKLRPENRQFVNDRIATGASTTTKDSLAIAVNVAYGLSVPSGNVVDIQGHYKANISPSVSMSLRHIETSMPIDMESINMYVRSLYVWRYQVATGNVSLTPKKTSTCSILWTTGLHSNLSPTDIKEMRDPSFPKLVAGYKMLLNNLGDTT